MSADLQSPFEGVAIFRRRPLFFVLVVLNLVYLAAVLVLCCKHVYLALDRARLAGEYLRLAVETGQAVSLDRWKDIIALAENTWGGPLWACTLLMLLMSRGPRLKHAVPARIGVRGEQLLINGDSAGPLSAITSVSVLPAGEEARTLCLKRRRRSAIALRVRDEAHAAALIQALGLSPTQQAVSYPLPFQVGDWLVLAAIGILLCLCVLMGFGFVELVRSWASGSIPAPSLLPELSEVRRMQYELFHEGIITRVTIVLLSNLRHFLYLTYVVLIVATMWVCDWGLYPRQPKAQETSAADDHRARLRIS